MFAAFVAGLSSIALLTLIFTVPTWIAARFFDAGHRSMARAALATAAGTVSGFVAAGLFGSGMVSFLLFVGAAAAVVMVVLDLNLPRAVGTVLFAGALMMTIFATLPEFAEKFLLPAQVQPARDASAAGMLPGRRAQA